MEAYRADATDTRPRARPSSTRASPHRQGTTHPGMTWAPEHARRERLQLTDGAKGAPVHLFSCQLPGLLTIAVADVRCANTVLTTTMAACRPTWTPASGPWVNYLIIWATTDTAGSAQPPENRTLGRLDACSTRVQQRHRPRPTKSDRCKAASLRERPATTLVPLDGKEKVYGSIP